MDSSDVIAELGLSLNGIIFIVVLFILLKEVFK